MTDPADAAHIRRLISLIDLTSLGEQDDAATVRALAAQAVTPGGPVAALCVWPKFLGVAKAGLGAAAIPVAVVTNFPQGDADPERAGAETAQAVGQGADEIDVVFPYRAFLDGDRKIGARLVRACRDACGTGATLKVILESGQLGDATQIAAAARIAIEAGADFLKTSTGKTQPGATPAAAAVMIEVIAGCRAEGRAVGFKASGGVRTLADANLYLELFEQVLGEGSADPAHFRIGASSLLAELVAALPPL